MLRFHTEESLKRSPFRSSFYSGRTSFGGAASGQKPRVKRPRSESSPPVVSFTPQILPPSISPPSQDNTCCVFMHSLSFNFMRFGTQSVILPAQPQIFNNILLYRGSSYLMWFTTFLLTFTFSFSLLFLLFRLLHSGSLSQLDLLTVVVARVRKVTMV